MTRKVRCSCGRTFWVVAPQTEKAQCLCGAFHDPEQFHEPDPSQETFFSLSVPFQTGDNEDAELSSLKHGRRDGSSRAATATKSSFESHQYGYSFVADPGWSRCHARIERRRGADLAIEHEELGAMKCVVSPCNLDFDAVVKRLRVASEIEVEDFAMINRARETLAGSPGAMFEYEGTFAGGDGTRYRIIRYAFLREGNLFQIVALAPSSDFTRLKDEVVEIVHSLKF